MFTVKLINEFNFPYVILKHKGHNIYWFHDEMKAGWDEYGKHRSSYLHERWKALGISSLRR